VNVYADAPAFSGMPDRTTVNRAGEKWSQWESNPRPLACHASALPTELWPRAGTPNAITRVWVPYRVVGRQQLVANGPRATIFPLILSYPAGAGKQFFQVFVLAGPPHRLYSLPCVTASIRIHAGVLSCHPRAGGDPGKSRRFWIPACAGMTDGGGLSRNHRCIRGLQGFRTSGPVGRYREWREVTGRFQRCSSDRRYS
jgi:hypothetical protein